VSPLARGGFEAAYANQPKRGCGCGGTEAGDVRGAASSTLVGSPGTEVGVSGGPKEKIS
jgi:hypothetical protein